MTPEDIKAIEENHPCALDGCYTCAALAALVDAGARAREQAIEEREQKLRELLWLRHGCLALYGDDGEMQCGKCVIDFKRDAPERIAARFEQIGHALLQPEAPRAPGGA